MMFPGLVAGPHWEMGYNGLQALIRQSGPGMQIPGCGC